MTLFVLSDARRALQDEKVAFSTEQDVCEDLPSPARPDDASQSASSSLGGTRIFSDGDGESKGPLVQVVATSSLEGVVSRMEVPAMHVNAPAHAAAMPSTEGRGESTEVPVTVSSWPSGAPMQAIATPYTDEMGAYTEVQVIVTSTARDHTPAGSPNWRSGNHALSFTKSPNGSGKHLSGGSKAPTGSVGGGQRTQCTPPQLRVKRKAAHMTGPSPGFQGYHGVELTQQGTFTAQGPAPGGRCHFFAFRHHLFEVNLLCRAGCTISNVNCLMYTESAVLH